MYAVKILAVLCFLLGTSQVENQRQYTSWQELFTSSLFKNVVTGFAHDSYLDALVPAECFGRNEETIQRFLQSLPIPVRFFTDIRASSVGGIDGTLKFRMYNLVVLVCDHTPWSVHVADDSLERALFHHFMKLYVIPERYVNRNTDPMLKIPSNIIRHPGINLSVVNNTIIFKDESQEGCLNCAGSEYLHQIPVLRKNLKVNQAVFFGWCTVTYTCAKYTFTTLLDTLRRRNATVKVIQAVDNWRDTEHAMDALSYGNVFVELSQQFDFWNDFAHTRMPQFYDTTGYRFLVKGLEPIPKEEVLILPFTGNVWAALLLSMALYILFAAVVTRALQITSVKMSHVVSPFFSTLLQQSEPPSSELTKKHSFRLLLSVWSIVTLVMATAFKGCLVSLLRDLPLRGKLPDYWSSSTIIQQGYRICIITSHLGYFHVTYLPQTLRRGEKHLDCITNNVFNIVDDGRDSFLIRYFPFGQYEALRRQLHGLGFVETRREALDELAGPLMHASSPYLKDFGKVIIDGVMFGLYARAGSLEEFKAGYSRSLNSVLPETESTLTLHDLRPYFLVWATGMGLGLVVFLVE
ncbi:unnamed protein product, partial [Ixodes pacificus]